MRRHVNILDCNKDCFINCGNCGYCQYYLTPGFISLKCSSCSQFDIDNINPKIDGCTFGSEGLPRRIYPQTEVEVW